MTRKKSEFSLRIILRALQSKNYRLFFAGQAVSLIGTWMQTIAMSWLVYRLTGSPFLLGAVGFAADIPSFLFMPFAGVFADRFNRRKILIATQALSMIQAFVLALLVLSNTVQVWHLFVLAVFLGTVNAFDMPTRHSFVVDMIEQKEDLPNAIALNSLIFNGARLVGPSVAGILIASVGEGYCFFLNGASYMGVIIALLAMNIRAQQLQPRGSSGVSEVQEGFSYTFRFTPLRNIILLTALVSLVGISYNVLMPIIAKDVLQGGPNTLGYLMGSAGIGALVAAVLLAARRSVLGLGKLIPAAATLFGVGLMLLYFSSTFYIAMAVMPLIGFGIMTQLASSNTLIQTIVDEDKRGRVMSIYTMAFRGIAPFGSLIAGSMAAHIGALNTLLLNGAALILGALLFAQQLPAMKHHIRPIYIRQGIIPEVASGIESVSEAKTD